MIRAFGTANAEETYIFEEELRYATRLLVDEIRDTLHAPTVRETTNSGLCDTLDVVVKNLAMMPGAALSETLVIKTMSMQVERVKRSQDLTVLSSRGECRWGWGWLLLFL
jgi:hypothetical protein